VSLLARAPPQTPLEELIASIKMGIFDKSSYIVNTGIIEQVFQCTAKVILLAKTCCISVFTYLLSLRLYVTVEKLRLLERITSPQLWPDRGRSGGYCRIFSELFAPWGGAVLLLVGAR